ncbi:MAG: methyl-accepting chemotaxis protein [Spirochaetia bacterium]
MKIRTKINLTVFVIIAAFIAAVVLLMFTAYISRSLNDMETESTHLLADMYKLNSLTKDLLVSELGIRVTWENWNNQIEATGDRLNSLLNHPATSFLPGEIIKKLGGNVNLWSLMIVEFDKAKSSLDHLLDNETIPDEQLIGLVRLSYSTDSDQFLTAVDKYYAAKVSRDFTVLLDTASDFLDSNIKSLVTMIGNQSSRITQTSILISIIFSSVIVFGSILFALLFSRSLSRKITAIEGVMREAAAKDLTVRSGIQGRDELGSLGTNLNSVVGSLAEFMQTVKNTTAQIGEMEESLSAGTAESASAVNQISKNIESITGSINSLNENIQLATQRVEDIGQQIGSLAANVEQQSEAVSRSSASIEEMNASIQNISKLAEERKSGVEGLLNVTIQGGEKVASTNEMIKSVSHEISDILEIIEIINSISEQTNLLSMNAAIESAHAGEIGKGFAVVAEEIRKLAESTSENSRNIESSLKSITGKIAEALHLSDESYTSFEDIKEEVTRYAHSLKEISSSMEEISQGSNEILKTTSEISAATRNVKDGSQEINTWIGEINKAMISTKNLSHEVTQGMDEIKTGTGEILSTVTDISKMSDNSRNRMNKLDLMIGTYKTNGN